MAESGKVIIIDGEPHCDCGVLDKMIYDGLCYDIQMVKKASITTDELKEFLMLEDASPEMLSKASQLCPSCPFNQLTG